MYYIYYLDWETGKNLEAWVPIHEYLAWVEAVQPVTIFEKRVVAY